MRRLAPALLVLTLLAGCAAAPAAVRPAASRAAAGVAARALGDDLRKNVLDGFRQIFKTYDQAPTDDRLGFNEFGHVVVREWFDAHDADGDGFIVFAEWHTPAEAEAQIAAIVAAGRYHVKVADKDADGALSLDEHLARTELEIDATPWLAGTADPDIRANAFKRFATGGKLSVDGATRMIGALLAQGYYVDDGRNVPLAWAVRLPQSTGRR